MAKRDPKNQLVDAERKVLQITRERDAMRYQREVWLDEKSRIEKENARLADIASRWRAHHSKIGNVVDQVRQTLDELRRLL